MSSSENHSRFGRYRLTTRIATGGMAEVYVGRRVLETGGLGPMVAVKRLLPHLASDPQVVRMFLNEAKVTAQIDHPNVVRIFDLGAEDGEPYIAMELLDGRSFAEVREAAGALGRRVPVGITLRVLADACRGLDAAHRAVDDQGRMLRIVHRDFTPDNVHVGVSGAVKVIDFGIAAARGWAGGTEPGTLKGKFFYMSPEMIAGRPLDHRADVFAAGVMLYEQLCGRRPFTGASTDEVVQRIARDLPRSPSEVDPAVPPALASICLRALEKDPAHRFQTLLGLVQAIEGIGGVAEVATPPAVAAYMAELFPVDRDPQRQRLQRARQADPSMPSVPPLPEPPAADPQDPTLELEHASAAKPRSLRWGALVAAVVAGLGAGTYFWPRAPPPHPEQLLARAGKDASGTRDLRALAQDPRATPAQLRAAAQRLLTAGDAEGALQLAEASSRRAPTDARGPLLEARAALTLQQGKRAASALDVAAQLAPRSAEPELLRADLREAQGDSTGVLEALTRAEEKAPGSLEVGARRGYALSQLGRLDEAAQVLERTLQRKFDPASAAELAFVRFRQGAPREALPLLRRTLKADPALSKGHYYLGAVLYQQADVKGAERAYREADRLAPQDPRPLAALCEMQAQTRSAEVEATRKEISARFPASASTLLARCTP